MIDTADQPRVGEVGRARAAVEALRTLAQIRREGRTVATDDERGTLAGWCGWGPLAKAFAPQNDTWVEIADQVRAALAADEVDAGFQAVYNAFYTPQPIAEAMWKLLAATGFSGGRVLEPGCGSGRFMATAPDGVKITGVDRDPVSAAICSLLHPQANVLAEPFQSARLVPGYAAAIGNVPYGDVRVFDTTAPDDVRACLHDYFIWRTMHLLAPGGVAVLLTSRYTMDKRTDGARREIGRLAELVGAFRLPNGALADGGTDVLADVLVLRRRVDDAADRGFAWFKTDSGPFDSGERVNEFWIESPAAVLGEMSDTGRAQYGQTLAVRPRAGDASPAQQLGTGGVGSIASIAFFRELMWQPPLDLDDPAGITAPRSPQGWHEGSLHVHDDAIVRVEDGRLTPVRQSAELTALLHLRDLAVKLLELEANHSVGDAIIAPIRKQTAEAYARYVRRFGALNRSKVTEGPVDEDTGLPTYRRTVPTMGGFRHDPDAQLVFALEVFDDETAEANPAPILTARQNRPVVRPTSTEDPGTALAWSMDRTGGHVDVHLIGQLLGVSALQVPVLLGDRLYRDPADQRWLVAEEYLSGDVRRKLAVAELAAATAPQEYARNVEALQAVQPPWLGPADIVTNINAPWVRTEDLHAFLQDLLGGAFRIRRVPETNQWEVKALGGQDDTAMTAEWGTGDYDAVALVQQALNGKVPVVFMLVRDADGEVRERKDPDASLLAGEKQTALKERFSEWIWQDPARTDRIVTEYNTTFNCRVARKFDGSHITVDGLAPWFTPYAHQLEYVARAVASPAALCGHPVGAGKTASMAMTAMKLRQLGLVRKPLVVVPNHLIEQIDREFRQLFPAARILSAASGSISKNRRLFTARCATQEWDIVIITHSAFNLMPVAPQTEANYLEEQLLDLEAAVRSAAPEGKPDGRMAKALAKRKDNMQTRLLELRDRVFGYDTGVTFERAGFDYLLLDEAHYYKNLSVPVRTDGFSVRPSKRATDLEVKLYHLARRGTSHAGEIGTRRYASLFTGTPVSNTMLELYVMMRYLMPEQMRRLGLGSADAWAAAFVQFVTSVDVTIDGGSFELKTKPSLFVNAPELRMLLSQVADIRTAQQLGLKRPASTVETVVCARTRAQAQYSDELVERAERVKQRGRRQADPKDPYANDNMLAICGDGRRMATDPALVGITDHGKGKIYRAAARIAKVWRQHPDKLQIAFCDVGTPGERKGPQTYGRLRSALVEQGMDARRIRFIHEARTDGDRAQLFSDCRTGKVSVIMGSTDKLGVGTNIQRHVVAMHHLDAPFRPADVEQRDGRGLRPGNTNALVRIFRYVTERTFDAYMWQMLTRKIGFITQIMAGTVDRTIEDVGTDMVELFAATKAVATGQPLLLERGQVESTVRRLRGLQRGHKATAERLRYQIRQREQLIRTNETQIRACDAIAASWTGELTEQDAAALHEEAKSFGYWKRWEQPFRRAGLTITFGEWTNHTRERTDRQPELRVTGATGTATGEGSEHVSKRAWRFWTPQRLAREVTEIAAGAADRAAAMRADNEQMRSENERAAALADRPFAEAEQLATAVARRDQIDAELQAAALREERAQAAAENGEPPAPDDELDDDIAALLGDLMDDYDPYTPDVLAELVSTDSR